jgi:hypothetical protein
LGLVAREVRAARALDARRVHHFRSNGHGDGRAFDELAVLVDDQISNGGGLSLLERPALAAQSDEAIAAAVFGVAARRDVFAALVAHRALDLEPRAQ